MKRDFKYLTIVHCSKREQADYLYAEVGAAAGHTREEVLACWDKYKEKTCYGIIRDNPWEEPAIAFCGPIDDRPSGIERLFPMRSFERSKCHWRIVVFS